MDAVYIFSQAHGLGKIFFLVPLVLIGPFFEEAANHADLFSQHFRGSYSLRTSTALLVMWTAVCCTVRSTQVRWWQCSNRP